MRDIEDWADWVYRPRGRLAHLLPFGGMWVLCGMQETQKGWRGTGTWGERERAASMPQCTVCLGLAERRPKSQT